MRNDVQFPLGKRMLGGRLLLPSKSIVHGRALSQSLIDDIQASRTRNNQDVKQILNAGNNSISGPLRALDGPGSSLDLPVFQKHLITKGIIHDAELRKIVGSSYQSLKDILTSCQIDHDRYDLSKKSDWCETLENKQLDQASQQSLFAVLARVNNVRNIPSTLTFASDIHLTIHLEPASTPDCIEYIAPDYHINPDQPMRFSGPVDLEQVKKNKQLYAPFFILHNIFGLNGIRIILDKIHPFALAGGMESSNAFNMALILAANMLSGAQLTMADLFSLAVKIENDEFLGLTGGQGHICFLGLSHPASLNIWTSGLTHDDGSNLEFGVFCADVFNAKMIDQVSQHILMLQTGKEYLDGYECMQRTSAMTNAMWIQLLEDDDAIGLPLHQAKLDLVIDFVQSIQQFDFLSAKKTVQHFVNIRQQLIERWLTLMLSVFHPAKLHQLSQKEQAQARYYHDCVFSENHTEYAGFALLRTFYRQYGDDLSALHLYTYPSDQLHAEALKQGISIMPLGAGGPGAIQFAISKRKQKSMRDFFEAHAPAIGLFDAENADKIIHSSGLVQGYLPLRIDQQGLQIDGFVGCERIQYPDKCHFDQLGGVFIKHLTPSLRI